MRVSVVMSSRVGLSTVLVIEDVPSSLGCQILSG